MKSLAFAALVSMIAVMLVAIPGHGGTITATWTENEEYEPDTLYGNAAYRDWAVWGKTGVLGAYRNSTDALFQKGGYGQEAPPINPTMYLIGGATGGSYWAGGVLGPYLVAPDTDNYGGLSLTGNQQAGAGFLIQANLQAGDSLKVWATSYETSFSLTASGGFATPVTVTRPQYSYGWATFTTSTPTVLNVMVQQGAATSSVDSVYVGAAAIEIAAVPEPTTLSLAALGGLPLLAIPRRRKV